MSQDVERYAEVRGLYDRLSAEFGELGPKIFQVILSEIGGLRLRIPDLQDQMVIERNDRIRKLFNGRNYEELSLRFNISMRHVRRILAEGP